MTDLSPQELEGRLNAQRETLVALMAWALRQSGNDLQAHLEDGLSVQDHSEDPGAVPDAAFAIEAAAAAEKKLLLDRARALCDATP